MTDCPSDIRLALFVESQLTESESAQIRHHIAACAECSEAFRAGLELHNLRLSELPETGGDGDSKELNERDGSGHSSDSTGQSSPDSTSKTGRPLQKPDSPFGSLWSTAAAGGTVFLSGVELPTTHNPGLAAKNEKNSPDDVRNDAECDSESTGHQQSDDAANRDKENPMQNLKQNGGVQDAPHVIGSEGDDGQSEFVQQRYSDTCAIRCQELILRDFGLNIPEENLCREAAALGWYTPGNGTALQDVGKLLEVHGVEVNRYDGANIFNLTSELAQGHRVIIGVDSGELWHGGLLEKFKDFIGLEQANHALLVSGIDTTDPDNVRVILTDPGSGDIAKAYPIDQFIDAWKDSNCFMVATSEPAPLDFNPEMVNFNYELGHLSTIGELPYVVFDQVFGVCMDLPPGSSLLGDQAEAMAHAVGSAAAADTLMTDLVGTSELQDAGPSQDFDANPFSMIDEDAHTQDFDDLSHADHDDDPDDDANPDDLEDFDE